MVRHRETGVRGDRGRRADRQERTTHFHEVYEIRDGRFGGHAAEHVLISLRNVSSVSSAESTAAPPTSGDPSIFKDEDVEFVLEPRFIQRLWVDHFVRELVLLEHPARPAGRHRTAVSVPEAHQDRAQLQRVDGRRRYHADEVQPELGRHFRDERAAHGRGRHPQGSSGPSLPTGGHFCRYPVDFLVGPEQAIRGDDRVGYRVTHEEAGSVIRIRDPTWRRYREALHHLEGSVEAVQDAIELDTHLQC